MAQAFSIVGTRVPKVDGRVLVTGKALYSIDEYLPRMLFAKILRSPYAHAKISNIDTSKAEALPGVRAVLTYKDVKNIGINNGGAVGDQKVLDSTMRYVGEEVAAVAADTEEIADAALKLIKVDYTVLPAVFDPEAAIQAGAPLVQEEFLPTGNLIGGKATVSQIGDVEAGFKQSFKVYEETFTTFSQAVNPLGRLCTVAWWEGDNLNVIESCPSTKLFHDQLMAWLEMPSNKIRYMTKFMGVSMGGSNVYRHVGIGPYLAKKANRPVKVITDHRYGMLGSVRRRQRSKVTLKVGVNQDGTIQAIYAKVIWDKGTTTASGPTSITITGRRLFEAPNQKDEIYSVYTNTPPNGAYRGYGGEVPFFVLETMMDRIAYDLGINPLDFRLKNYTKGKSTKPLQVAAQRCNWNSKWMPPSSKSGTKRTGIGIGGVIGWAAGYGSGVSAATIRLQADGTVELSTAVSDIGEGPRTTLSMVAAEVLGMKVADVTIFCGDSALPPDSGSYGGRIAVCVGTAVYNACQDLKSKVFVMVAPKLGVKPEDLDAKDGAIIVKSDTSKKMTWKDAAVVVGSTVGAGCLVGWGARPLSGPITDINPISSQIAEVEVDTETGEVTIIKITNVNDVGQALNPAICESQMAGATANALGYAMLEDAIYDPATGAQLNANFLEQKMTSMLDHPANLDLVPYQDEPNPCTPLGQRGFGESCLCPVTPAINNAIFNAIGVSSNDVPINPARMLKLLKKV